MKRVGIVAWVVLMVFGVPSTVLGGFLINDVSIMKDDGGITTVNVGQTITYTIVMEGDGTAPTQADVLDLFASRFKDFVGVKSHASQVIPRQGFIDIITILIHPNQFEQRKQLYLCFTFLVMLF